MVKLAERSAAYIWNPNGDIDFINPSAIMADISAGDLKISPPTPPGEYEGWRGVGGTNPPTPLTPHHPP